MTKNNKGRSGGDRPTPKNYRYPQCYLIRETGRALPPLLVCIAAFCAGASLAFMQGGVQ